ncbi:MAG: hypothetical protein FJ144_22875 [Deltaproteobacteria bacterium]|nr:hypothetical protein [Deltaproteobacteria bacterium]
MLRDEKRLEWHEIPSAELPGGVRAGIRAVYRDDGASYELFFDEEDLLVRARGPIDLSPLGAGSFDAVFGEFRHVDEYRLPWTGTYSFEGEPFFNERVRGWYPHTF